jgi:hypothetical protein
VPPRVALIAFRHRPRAPLIKVAVVRRRVGDSYALVADSFQSLEGLED